MVGNLRVIDLFSGCGGLSMGFQNAGFKIVAAFDNWQPAIDVYKENFNHPIFKRDLGDTSDLSDLKSNEPDIIIGGPPCQDFSSAGLGDSNGSKANLTKAFSTIISSIKPKYFVFENVPRARLSRVFKDAISQFRKTGYGLTLIQLDAAYCGVPQTRKRLFIIGSLDSEDDFCRQHIQCRLSEKPLTMREYFGKDLSIDYYFRVPTNYTRRGIFSIDAPCKTIRAIDRPLAKGYKGHKDDPIPVSPNIRQLTIEERGQVQTFPKSFVFKGTKTNLNTMIGNAVPVKLGEFVATSLHEFIKQQ